MKVAAKLIDDQVIENVLKERYASFDSGIGADFEAGKVTLKELATYIENKTDEEINATLKSGRQERIKQTLNNYIFSVLGS